MAFTLTVLSAAAADEGSALIRAAEASQQRQSSNQINGWACGVRDASASKAKARLRDGNLITVTPQRDTLCDEKENSFDKSVMLRVKAEYNVLSRALRPTRLVDFVEYVSQIDEESLARMTRRGANAWKDVVDATAWVDELRGGKQ